jgi:hypothetical protein
MCSDFDERGRRQLSAFGEVLSIAAWAEQVDISPRALRDRLKRLPAEVALSLSPKAKYGELPELGEPRSWSWSVLQWEDDPWAQTFVEEHPGGATLEEVAEVLGVTRERVRQIESKALRKLRRMGAFRKYQFGEWWE